MTNEQERKACESCKGTGVMGVEYHGGSTFQPPDEYVIYCDDCGGTGMEDGQARATIQQAEAGKGGEGG